MEKFQVSIEDKVIAKMNEFIRVPFTDTTVIAKVLDSLSFVEAIFELEEILNIAIPVTELSDKSTIKDFLEVVKKAYNR